MTLGSLFDGICGFPLAAVRNGITPVWASEIEKFPVEVGKYRFPQMRQLGDITQIDGKAIAPVDIITGGSPCQDLSVAGRRAGLGGERSGLFMQQIRITKEMRCADEQRGRTAKLVRPRFLIWENVPGAFSSEEGEDFRIVLEEICRIADERLSIPRPADGSWKYAGAVLGNEFSLAWRILDAQYWGVPQRRRRIFLVADFGGHAAPKILFEQNSLPGHIAPRKGTRQGAAAAAGNSPKNSGGAAGVISKGSGECFLMHEKHTALSTGGGQAGQGFPCVMTAAFNYGAAASRDIGYQTECSPTLRTNCNGAVMVSPSVPVNNEAPLIMATQQGGAEIGIGICPTITSAAGTSGNNSPVLFENHSQDCRYKGPLSVAPTINAGYGEGGNNQSLIAENTFCIAGNIIDRQAHNGGNGFGYQENISYTLNTGDRHAIMASPETYQKVIGSSCRGDEKGIGNQYVSQDKCIIAPSSLVRRLTPLECERLQGFPDYWTHIPGASDSARYKALGNSVAIPCVEYILAGVAYFLRLENYSAERIVQ